MPREVSCRLVHHGAAASSSPHCLVWMPPTPLYPSQIAYSSHGILNLCMRQNVVFGSSKESIWSVSQTLRTSMPCAEPSKRVITSLANVNESLVCGFSNGTVTMWTCNGNHEWTERPILTQETGRSITHLDGHYCARDNRWVLFTCLSDGTQMITFDNEESSPAITQVSNFAANVVKCQVLPFDKLVVLIGTAAPRHNKIHVHLLDASHNLHHCGSLTGHEDWITCLAWNTTSTLLASGSQDAKIRLWEFTTTASEALEEMAIVSDHSGSTEEEDDLLDDEDEEGEARLELIHDKGVTRVTLEALLFGHEEAVTSVCFHPNPMPLYRQAEILISSSMDRTLLIWSVFTGVWTPLTRVGSAGGILGGSIGSTLLGFVDFAVEPINGTCLVGHAYGGALHVWNVVQDADIQSTEDLSLEDIAMYNKWKAMPCITGHFDGVTDLCWEAENGDYLLTVSADQTCRLWAPLKNEDNDNVWLELARPQVHGYDLVAVTSLSTKEHRHLYVSGADEKEARVFDAPMSTIRLLETIYGEDHEADNGTARVECAYIPSLGLSQKASAADGAEMDTSETDVVTATKEELRRRVPLERDLGVVSLWPEVRKLFGHNTELFCLASTVSACSGPKFETSPFSRDVLVASSAKARDVDAASIRLWDAERGKCNQVLAGGHRSTVAALCFSPDGRYLVSSKARFLSHFCSCANARFIQASSGKDRRLCLWSRNDDDKTFPTFSLSSAIDSAHKRIVWGLHFCPFDASLLASGSRDGCVKLWKVSDTQGIAEGSRETPFLTEVSS